MSINNKEILEKIANIKFKNTVVNNDPDSFYNGAVQTLDEEKNKIEIQRLQIELDQLNHAYKLSSYLTHGIFSFVVLWMIAVFVFLCYQVHLPKEIRLDDVVIITLLSTTTINILALLFLVIKYVFNHRLKM